MTELNYKELQEKGIFDVPYRAFEFMRSQQAKIDLLEKELTETQAFLNKQNHIKQAKIDELQARVDVYDEHVKTLKNIHENDFNEESESSYILGNLDGFFECIESDLKVARDD